MERRSRRSRAQRSSCGSAASMRDRRGCHSSRIGRWAWRRRAGASMARSGHAHDHGRRVAETGRRLSPRPRPAGIGGSSSTSAPATAGRPSPRRAARRRMPSSWRSTPTRGRWPRRSPARRGSPSRGGLAQRSCSSPAASSTRRQRARRRSLDRRHWSGSRGARCSAARSVCDVPVAAARSRVSSRVGWASSSDRALGRASATSRRRRPRSRSADSDAERMATVSTADLGLDTDGGAAALTRRRGPERLAVDAGPAVSIGRAAVWRIGLHRCGAGCSDTARRSGHLDRRRLDSHRTYAGWIAPSEGRVPWPSATTRSSSVAATTASSAPPTSPAPG